jgi:hypothetical protein
LSALIWLGCNSQRWVLSRIAKNHYLVFHAFVHGWRYAKSIRYPILSSSRKVHAPASRAWFWSSPFRLAYLYNLDHSEN